MKHDTLLKKNEGTTASKPAERTRARGETARIERLMPADFALSPGTQTQEFTNPTHFEK